MALPSPKNCPRCDGSLAGTETTCPHCRLPLSSSKLAGAAVEKSICPICKLPAYEAVFGGMPAIHCAECKGLGVKRENMMKLQAYGPKELAIGSEEQAYKRPQFFEPRQKPPFLICPFCKKRMKAASLSKAAVDLCEVCGAIWLEGDKIEAFNDLLGPYKWKVSKDKK